MKKAIAPVILINSIKDTIIIDGASDEEVEPERMVPLFVAVAVAMKLAHDCCVARGMVVVPAVVADP